MAELDAMIGEYGILKVTCNDFKEIEGLMRRVTKWHHKTTHALTSAGYRPEIGTFQEIFDEAELLRHHVDLTPALGMLNDGINAAKRTYGLVTKFLHKVKRLTRDAQENNMEENVLTAVDHCRELVAKQKDIHKENPDLETSFKEYLALPVFPRCTVRQAEKLEDLCNDLLVWEQNLEPALTKVTHACSKWQHSAHQLLRDANGSDAIILSMLRLLLDARDHILECPEEADLRGAIWHRLWTNKCAKLTLPADEKVLDDLLEWPARHGFKILVARLLCIRFLV